MTPKLIRVTTVPISLLNLLKHQLRFMSSYFDVLAVSSPGETLQDVANQEGVRIAAVPMTRTITPLKDLTALYRLYRLFKKERPQIVHSHTPKAGLLAMTAGWLAGVPIRIHTVAGMPLMETGGAKKALLLFVEKVTYLLCTRVYPNSTGLAEYILKNRLASSKKVRVLAKGSSNGIDADYFDPQKVELQLNSKAPARFTFAFVGRIVKDKGVNELIQAFLKLNAEFPETRLQLIGFFEQTLDPVLPATENAIKNHPAISFVGYHKDYRHLLLQSNVLVLPTYREGLPNVLLQAGALGVPVIATQIVGCTDIVQHNVNGLLVKPKSVNELHDAMRELLMNEQLYNQLRRRAREHILGRYEQKFVWNEILKEYVRLLKSRNIPTQIAISPSQGATHYNAMSL